MATIATRLKPQPSRLYNWLKLLAAIALVYFFLCGINMMGAGLKLIGKEHEDFVKGVFCYAEHPLIGLFVGILITSIFQSSSFTTSFTVGLVAAGQLSLRCAIPIVMGANIGTSVTSLLVSFGYIRRRDEFQKAFAGAILNENFKLLAVLVLLPLEIVLRPIERVARHLSGFVTGEVSPGVEPTNWLKEIIKPVVGNLKVLLTDVLHLSPTVAGAIMGTLGIVLLFVALIYLVKILQSLVMAKVERFFGRYLFRNALVAYMLGLLLTASVQSSSVTISLLVPLVGAGLLTLPQIFPYILGADIGTTVTALIASFATAAVSPEAARLGVALALAHLLFNVTGACVFWPLRVIPIRMANFFAYLCRRSRKWAVVWVATLFYGLPILAILIYSFVKK